jgi:hypothetical protein
MRWGPRLSCRPPAHLSHLRTHVSCHVQPHGPPFSSSPSRRLPCVPFAQSPPPQHLPPFVVSCPHITYTKAPLSPPPHLHYTGAYNLLVKHATSSTSHPVNRSAGPGGPSRRPPRPQKAELTRTIPDPKRVVIAVVGGG